MEDLIPAPFGAHSTVGRATNRGMDKMRAIAVELEHESKKAAEVRKEAAERIAAERAQGITGGGHSAAKPAAKPVAHPASASPSGAANEETALVPHKTPKGARPPAPLDKQTSMGRAVRERLNLNPGSQEPTGFQETGQKSPAGLSPTGGNDMVPEPSSPIPMRQIKSSPAFTTTPAAVPARGRIHLKHFLTQNQPKACHPEVGHYRVQENLTQGRIKVSDFGYRQAHPSRSQPDLRDTSRELGPEDQSALDVMWTKSGSLFAHPSVLSGNSMSASCGSWKGESLFATSTARPEVGRPNGTRNGLTARVQMSETSGPGNAGDQDCRTSAVRRNPEFDIQKQMGRGSFFGKAGCEFFEVGKYAANHDAVLPKAKKGVGFGQQMSRSCRTAYEKKNTPASCDTSQHGTASQVDRSAYRQALIGRPRTTHVMEMIKDLDRPPMVVHKAALHDTNDPVVCQLVHERAMTCDSNTFDRASSTKTRLRDVHIGKSLGRERAGDGARNCQMDVAMRRKQGQETKTEMECSVEQLKDSLRNTCDLSMSFDQSKGRGHTKLKAKFSVLHRPRNHAAPDFTRAPPFQGFDTRTAVSRSLKVNPRTRSHDAMPGWSAEIVDDLVSSDVDGW